MRIAIASDFHGTLPDIPPCELLLIGGDLAPFAGGEAEMAWLEWTFAPWLKAQPADEIVGIAGNHDLTAEKFPSLMRTLPWTYLENQTTEKFGLRIHGSPYSNQFGNWAFMASDEALAYYWEMIPDDTDILMVHGPAHQILDRVYDGREEGSKTLRKRLDALGTPLVVTGHIHEARGVTRVDGRLHINAAILGDGHTAIVDWTDDGPKLVKGP